MVPAARPVCRIPAAGNASAAAKRRKAFPAELMPAARPGTGDVIATGELVEVHSAPGTRLGDLLEILLRLPFLRRSILRLAAFPVRLARLVLVHGDLADDAVPDAAELAGEDVAVVLGGEETAPVAGGAWTGAEVFCCFVVGFGCFVEPSR